MRLAAFIVMLLLGPALAFAEGDEQRTRLRLMPARPAALVDVEGAAAPDHEGFDRLGRWIEKRKFIPIAPNEAVFERTDDGKHALRSLVRRLYIEERKLPGSEGDLRVTRLPATLVIERSRWWSGKADVPTGPPPELLKKHDVQYTGSYFRVFLSEGTRTRLFERWSVEPKGKVDVGIYTDHGAHPNAVKTAAAACQSAGLTIRVLDARSVNRGAFRKQVKCVLMPGGWAEYYVTDISPDGVRHLRSFVDKGGGYVGVCAGAFYAMSDIVWEKEQFDYPLDLVAGTAIGPLDAVAPWPGHALATLELDAKHPLTRGLGETRKTFYLGGPSLHPDPKLGKRADVLARYAEGGAAIVSVTRKRGRIYLTAVHLEYDLTSDRDDLTWPESEGELADPESDWDLFLRGVQWAVGGSRR